jgi:hypothetical protein
MMALVLDIPNDCEIGFCDNPTMIVAPFERSFFFPALDPETCCVVGLANTKPFVPKIEDIVILRIEDVSINMWRPSTGIAG